MTTPPSPALPAAPRRRWLGSTSHGCGPDPRIYRVQRWAVATMLLSVVVCLVTTPITTGAWVWLPFSAAILGPLGGLALFGSMLADSLGDIVALPRRRRRTPAAGERRPHPHDDTTSTAQESI